VDFGGKVSPAITVAVYAALAYDVISATNSSPQTTELNASERSQTLMKWVKIGELQIAAFAIAGSLLDKSMWPAVGAAIGGGLMWVQYQHAMQAGLASGLPAPSNAR
jgi:hypothetical protein